MPSGEGFALWRQRNADWMGTKGWSGLYSARLNVAGDYEIGRWWGKLKHRYVEVEEHTAFLRGKLLTELELAVS
jgi:hypothetical protein